MFEKLRSDFPLLQKNGKPIIYFDSACMSLKPDQVVKKMDEYYYEYPACAGRSNHKLGQRATEEFNSARKTIAKFINAKENEIIFTKNTTEGLNLVYHIIDFKKGDIILTTDKEHNSNLLPIHLLKERGIKHEIVPSQKDGTFDMDRFESMMSKNVRLVSMVHTSNIDGTTIPAKEIIKIAHDFKALTMLDGAQSVPHQKTDVKKLDADFLAFSGHKMLGPSIGVLFGKYSVMEKAKPFLVGGDTVESTTYKSHKFLKPPERYEAGLQNYAGAIGLGEACRYLEKIIDKTEKHEIELNKIITDGIKNFEGLKIIGPEAEKRGGIISFYVKGMHYHDIALMLDETANIMIRSGQHCVHSWFNAHNIDGSARASLYLYNTKEEAKVFIESLNKILKLR